MQRPGLLSLIAERSAPGQAPSLFDRLPTGGHDFHIGDSNSCRSAAGCYRQAVALREPSSDKIVEHLQFEAVAEQKRFHGGAVRIEGERPLLDAKS